MLIVAKLVWAASASLRVQVTTWPAIPHVQPVPLASVGVSDAFSVMVTVTSPDVEMYGPAFVTVATNVAVPPGVTVVCWCWRVTLTSDEQSDAEPAPGMSPDPANSVCPAPPASAPKLLFEVDVMPASPPDTSRAGAAAVFV